MLKVLIVEDEKLEREGLVKFLDWDIMKMEIVGLAVDGVDGFELTEQLRPDIVITDIKMPGMDGITMAKKIKTFFPKTKIIILSGYDDFNYAKAAINLRASCYLLKPVEEEELETALLNILEDLDKEKNIEYKLNNGMAVEKNLFFSKLLDGKLSKVEFEKRYFEYNIKTNLYEKFIGMGMYFMDQHNEVLENFTRDFEDRFSNEIIFNIRKTEDKRVFYCINTQVTLNIALKMERYIKEKKIEEGLNIIVGVGDEIQGLFNIKDSMDKVIKALDYGIFWSEPNVFKHNFIEELEKNYSEGIHEFIKSGNTYSKQVIYSVSCLDENKVKEILEELFDFVYRSQNVDKNYIKNYLYNIVYETSLLAYNFNKNEEWLFVNNQEFNNEFLKLDSFHKIHDYFLEFFEKVMEIINKTRSNKDENIIKNVIKLVEERYMTGINLKVIAAEVFLSPNYLGNLFKKFMSKTFNDYLCEYRMEKAKLLLTNSNKKISTVAEEVGMPNTSYFCMVFKNTYGLAPKEYQDMTLRG